VDTILTWLLRQMRRARFVFSGLYIVVSIGFLLADPRAGWTWFIIIAGALLCLLFWGLVAFWTSVFTYRQGRDGAGGTGHG
jgi:hypothetical protein